MSDDNVIEFKPQALKGKRTSNGASPERMREITRIRLQKQAERRAQGLTGTGRGRLKQLTDKEIRDRALQTAADLFDEARQKAINLLEKQIDHKDPSIAQRAAVKVLEYTDGKPNQPVTATTSNVTKVVYETAAIPPEVFMPGFGIEDDDAESA